jgi:molybdenum cofactor synthesis domain-containing protein
MNYVEIICVGNELLIGKTLNTNGQWLAKQITTLGLSIFRITIVRDEIDEISSIIKEAIRRKSYIIITTGGLGPTFDDKTLEGIANALELKTEINKEALTMITQKYSQYSQKAEKKDFKLIPHRIKMAKLPQGALPVYNPIGTAPAVIVNYKKKKIIALPGVPSELKAIFIESIAQQIKNSSEDVIFFEKSIHCSKVMESEIAPIIDIVLNNNPSVYIKSHPKGTEMIPEIEFHLFTTEKNIEIARDKVNDALNQIKKLIKQKGGIIKSKKQQKRVQKNQIKDIIK